MDRRNSISTPTLNITFLFKVRQNIYKCITTLFKSYICKIYMFTSFAFKSTNSVRSSNETHELAILPFWPLSGELRDLRQSIFKVYEFSFRGGNSVIYKFPSLFKRGLLLKERICSSWSKFFPLIVNPSLEGLCQLGKQTGSH